MSEIKAKLKFKQNHFEIIEEVAMLIVLCQKKIL